MVNITKISNLFTRSRKFYNNYKLIYSTGVSKTTLWDAFKEFNSKPHMAKKLAIGVNEAAQKIMPDADRILRPICSDLGEFGHRIKNIDKIKCKIPRAMKELTFDDGIEYINSGKISNVIGDGYGARIIINNPDDVSKLIKRLLNAHKKNEIKISLVENYRGKGINPYINDENLQLLQEVSRNSSVTVNKLKNAGYTRTNMDIFINGQKIEFQIGGRYTTRFGEIEHYLHDMRLNSTTNLSKLNDSQKELFYKMRKDYLLILGNKKLNEQYEDYLTKVWRILKTAEENVLPFPELPDSPEVIPKILSAKNLFKLECNP